jgi:hypothetical protein
MKTTQAVQCLGLARTIYTYVYTVHMVFLAGNLPYIRSYTVCIYGFDEPYKYFEVLPS